MPQRYQATGTSQIGTYGKIINVKVEINGVYNLLNNTSNWTIDLYAKNNVVPADGSNTTGQWAYDITSPYDWAPISTGGTVSSSRIQVSGNGDSVNLSGADWHKVATATINNAKHGLKQFSTNTNPRALNMTHFTIKLTSPNNGYYTGDSTTFNVSPAEWVPKDVDTSTVTATHANIGETTTIVISNPQSSGIYHNVYYSYDGGETKNIIGSEYRTDRRLTWTVPLAYYQRIPNDKRGIISIYVTTYDSNKEEVGTEYTTFWAYAVESDCKPSLFATIYDSNSVTVALTGDNTKLIKYKSNARYSISATAKNYATIIKKEAKNGSKTLISNTGTFNEIITNDFTFYATDSRGYVTSYVVVPDMVDYIQLTCTVDADAPTADGIMSFVISGNYYNGSFGAANNTLEVKYRIKEGNGSFSSWITVTPDIVDGIYTTTVTLTGLNYLSNYTIEAYAKDVFGQVDSNDQMVTAVPVFDFGISDFAMNVPMTVFGGLTVNGDITCTGTVNGQTSDGSTQGGICYGLCETESTVNAKMVTCGTFSELTTGRSIRVKFAYANSALRPTMNVNGTGAASIMRYGNTSDVDYMWRDGSVIDFVYDGQYWVMVDGVTATTTYYGKTKLTNSIDNTTTTALTPKAVFDLGIQSGSWTPTLGQSAAVSSYNVRQGWYQKIGKCVTIGFHVSVTTNSGYKDTNISITGLPYTPAYAAFGGGIAYNVYTPANQIFEGWTVDTTGTISARTQTENKTNADNLNIGSSVGYTNGSATMTVAGTICYMIS